MARRAGAGRSGVAVTDLLGVLGLMLLVASTGTVIGAEIVVYPTGDVTADLPNIQRAIDGAVHGDVILLRSVNDGSTFDPTYAANGSTPFVLGGELGAKATGTIQVETAVDGTVIELKGAGFSLTPLQARFRMEFELDSDGALSSATRVGVPFHSTDEPAQVARRLAQAINEVAILDARPDLPAFPGEKYWTATASNARVTVEQNSGGTDGNHAILVLAGSGVQVAGFEGGTDDFVFDVAPRFDDSLIDPAARVPFTRLNFDVLRPLLRRVINLNKAVTLRGDVDADGNPTTRLRVQDGFRYDAYVAAEAATQPEPPFLLMKFPGEDVSGIVIQNGANGEKPPTLENLLFDDADPTRGFQGWILPTAPFVLRNVRTPKSGPVNTVIPLVDKRLTYPNIQSNDFSEVRWSLIEDCHLQSSHSALQLRASSGVTIRRSKIENDGGRGEHPAMAIVPEKNSFGLPFQLDLCRDIVIEDCEFRSGDTAGACVAVHIFAGEASHITIERNTMRCAARWAGIDLRIFAPEEGNRITNVSIRDNVMEDGGVEFSFSTGDDTVVEVGRSGR